MFNDVGGTPGVDFLTILSLKRKKAGRIDANQIHSHSHSQLLGCASRQPALTGPAFSKSWISAPAFPWGLSTSILKTGTDCGGVTVGFKAKTFIRKFRY
jgi:hypothetical protein